MHQAGMESVGVLTRTREEAQKLSAETQIDYSISKDLRIHFLPVYLAKGLEFDAVIVWNSEDPYYQTENGKFVLYTACTRAMHRLTLLK